MVNNGMRTDTLSALLAELVRIRERYPWSSQLEGFAVLAEEVGEVARALNDGEPTHRLRAEAIQVAAVAIRFAEGDGV